MVGCHGRGGNNKISGGREGVFQVLVASGFPSLGFLVAWLFFGGFVHLCVFLWSSNILNLLANPL